MRHQTKVSVLTPIYNHSVEFIRECLDSLHAQTMRDIEFILIDNGAIRESRELIEEFIAKDSRFRCLHLVENVGYGRAMNYGLQEVCGEYVGFLESDDIALPTMYERLYDVITKHRCDVVKCDWISYLGRGSDKNSPHHNFQEKFCNKVFEPSYFPRFFLADPAIWTGLYRVEFIRENKLFFHESPTARYQDTSFNFKVLATVKSIYCIDEALIQYRRNTPNSSVKDRSAIFALVEEYDEIEAFLKDRSELRKRLVYVKNYNKARSYRWNYLRADNDSRGKFLEIFHSDFQSAVERKELDRSYFTDEEMQWLSEVVGVKFFAFGNENINISFSFDDKYFYQAMVAISSLLDQATSGIAYNFYLIVAEDISAAKIAELKDYISGKSKESRVVFCPQNEIFKNGYEVRGITRSAYYRLMLPYILPDVGLIIYSDVDVLFRSDLSELREMPMKNYAVAAVKDISINLKHTWEMLSSKFPYWKSLLSDMYGEYRNSGFLYMNLDRLRNLHWYDDILRYATMRLNFQDQDILNILLSRHKDLIYHLPPKYICMPKHLSLGNYAKAFSERVISKKEFDDIKKRPAIYHYPGPTKPWSNPDEDYNQAWCKYVKKNKFLSKKFDHLFPSKSKKLYKKINNANGYVKYFCGLPFESKVVNRNKRQHKRMFGLFATEKSDEKTKYKVLGVSLIKKDKRTNTIKLFGIPVYRGTRAARQEEELSRLSAQVRAQGASIKGIEDQLQSVLRKLSNMKCIIEAQTLHVKTFAPYKNAFKGQNVVLVCTGPSAKYYEPIKNAIHVGVNGSIYLEWLELDYLFLQDYTIRQTGNETLVRDALSYQGNNCKKFFGIIPSDRLAQVKKDIGRIPLRYADGPNICQYLLEDIRSHEVAYDLAREPLGEFGGTVFSALQFILYTNPKTLYIVGWDCNSGYAYNKSQFGCPANYQLKILKKHFIPFIEDQYSDLEIITINPAGLKGIFNDVYTEPYLRDHPRIEECVSLPSNS